MKRCYGFSSFCAMLCIDDALPCEWINSYLSPFFSNAETNCKRPIWNVIARISDGEIGGLESLYAKEKAAGNVNEYVELATAYTCLSNGDFLVRQSDPDTHVPESWLCIRPLEKTILLYLRSDNPEARYVVARVVRSVIVGQAMSDGWTLLHASCASVNHRAYIAVGNKGAGKTAILLEMIRGRNGLYVSNDRLLVKQFANELVVRGLPHSPAVKIEMLNRYGIAGAPSSYVFQGTATNRRFHVDELCRALGTAIEPQSSVKAVLIPRFAERAEDAGYLNTEVSRILASAEIHSICEFQPVWTVLFRIETKERSDWWANVPVIPFSYENASLADCVWSV